MKIPVTGAAVTHRRQPGYAPAGKGARDTRSGLPRRLARLKVITAATRTADRLGRRQSSVHGLGEKVAHRQAEAWQDLAAVDELVSAQGLRRGIPDVQLQRARVRIN